mmetsp:Transcript_10077/g.17154  ORF Transcript_10077/g.17154 Transcript_10077/m.17154 type:complete len:365 (-) Transcript_10077:190-1284(-)
MEGTSVCLEVKDSDALGDGGSAGGFRALRSEDVDLEVLAVFIADGAVSDIETSDAEGGADEGLIDTDREENELLGLDDKETDLLLPAVDEAIGVKAAPDVDGGARELATDDALGSFPAEFGFEDAKLRMQERQLVLHVGGVVSKVLEDLSGHCRPHVVQDVLCQLSVFSQHCQDRALDLRCCLVLRLCRSVLRRVIFGEVFRLVLGGVEFLLVVAGEASGSGEVVDGGALGRRAFEREGLCETLDVLLLVDGDMEEIVLEGLVETEGERVVLVLLEAFLEDLVELLALLKVDDGAGAVDKVREGVVELVETAQIGLDVRDGLEHDSVLGLLLGEQVLGRLDERLEAEVLFGDGCGHPVERRRQS